MKTRLFSIYYLALALAAMSSFADYTITFPAGVLTPAANQLDNPGGNTLDVILAALPNKSIVQKWNCSAFVIYTKTAGGWPASVTLNPGEGANVKSPSTVTVTFTGAAHVPVLPPTNACPCGGYSYLSCQTTNPGTYQNITGALPTEGSQEQIWNGTGFDYIYTFTSGAWTPTNPPVLAIGVPAFFYIPCATNPCITMTCFADKTVPCGTNWDFDAPTNIVDTCCTNYSLNFDTLTNSGPCPLVITRTWLVTDTCGNSNLCRQMVTVVDTTPPVFTYCPTNKTVPCGTTWSFDQPSAYDTCCSNVTIQLISSNLISGPCPDVWQGVWQAMDCCSNFATCTQTVTVLIPNTACSPLVSRPGIVSATIWEQTVSVVPHSFSISSPALLNQISGGLTPGNYDFASTAHEYYDVYLSDPDGTPNPNGCCVTVVCDATDNNVNFAVGDNIDSVELDFADGSHVGASSVGSIQPGSGITDPTLLASDGWATNALGLHDDNSTRLGQSFSRITLCFPTDCSSAKTVQCGSNWSFDPPSTFDSCCGSNVTVSVLNTITNGTACDLVITRTWEVTDCCSNKTTCNETVTVVDTTPPVINCKTNTVVVALNSNCQLVIPKISAKATDNCTPASKLIFNQSPEKGTIVPGPSQIVTVTVTDACGNSNSCQTTVLGLDKIGPVITGPSSLIVSNCLVPCVTNLVTVIDNCCPAFSINITQSPPCDTPIGPGINSVTVTATDCKGKTATKVIHLSVVTAGSFLQVLFNTGVDANKAILPFGTIDPHYTLGPLPLGVTGYTPPNALAILKPWNWLENPHVSEWITPAINAVPKKARNCPAGSYTYTNQFVLPVGTDAGTASLSGRWAADDGGAVYFNGVLQPFDGIPMSGASGFNHWHKLQINSGFLPNPSQNTILFVVTNVASGPRSTPATGLRVEYTNAIVCSTCAPPTIVSITSGHSIPNNGVAALSVAVAGTLPLSYQWYYNGAILSNVSPYFGVNTANLLIVPIHYANAGVYTVVISNACGSVSAKVSLTITLGYPFAWGWWNVAQLDNPLAATFGPDLVLDGTNTDTLAYAISSGSTEDFGLPAPGGQIVNVVDVAPLTPDASIQIPVIAPSGSNTVNSYTVVMDLYQPDTSSGTNCVLFRNACCLEANDGVEMTLDAQNFLHLDGFAAGVPFDVASALPLPVDAWNRMACVIDDPQDGVGVNIYLYLNGQPVASLTVPASPGLSVDWNNSPPTLLSSPDGATAEFYLSSIQFQAVALTSDQIAGIGSPDDGPAPANDTSVGPQPALSATMSNGSVNFSWTGSPYVLQETTDLASGNWVNASAPFSEVSTNGNIMTTAGVNPATEGPAKFYRLIFAP